MKHCNAISISENLDIVKFNVCLQTSASCLKMRCEELTITFCVNCNSRSCSIFKFKILNRSHWLVGQVFSVVANAPPVHML